MFKLRGGVYIDSKKRLLKNMDVEIYDKPKYVLVPIKQGRSYSDTILVKIGERVKLGQKIGDGKEFLSCCIHSPVSGEVIDIGDVLKDGNSYIRIKNDFLEESVEFKKSDYKALTKNEIIKKIREAGVAGLGGAAFPTHVKLSTTDNIHTLIVNAAECEPYITCDEALSLSSSDKIVQGIEIVKELLGIKWVMVAVEDNMVETIVEFEKALEGKKWAMVVPLEEKYPQGGEKQLVKSLLGKEVKPGKLTSDVGVFVQNVGTLKAVYNAVVLGRPLIERVVTVSGGAIKKPCNLKVKIGTPIDYILDYAGYFEAKKYIIGGPMMGHEVKNLNSPIEKGSSAVLALEDEEIRSTPSKPCIRCGDCVDVCPMGLMPYMYDNFVNTGKIKKMKKYHIFSCIECGCCEYVCPANVPLLKAIGNGKNELREMEEQK